jgi:hypothetical protein
MDIQITGITDRNDGFLYLERTIDGAPIPQYNKMPTQTLAIRAAEYDLSPDDPMALDIVLMENFIVLDKPQPFHPLHTCKTIDEALRIVWAQVEDAKTRNDAPEEPHLRSLFRAADLPVPQSTQGLTDVKERLLNYCDDKAPIWVTIHRDEQRKMANREIPYNLLDQLRSEALSILHDQASEENRIRISRTK